jgi:hypothetical protein
MRSTNMTTDMRAAFEAAVRGKPQFREVAPTGLAKMIIGARPAVAAVAPDDVPEESAEPQRE